MSAPRWEYRFLFLSKDRDLDQAQGALNDMGHDGWELVGLYEPTPTSINFIFKKPFIFKGTSE
jgi:hypothetical protein